MSGVPLAGLVPEAAFSPEVVSYCTVLYLFAMVDKLLPQFLTMQAATRAYGALPAALQASWVRGHLAASRHWQPLLALLLLLLAAQWALMLLAVLLAALWRGQAALLAAAEKVCRL